MNRLTTSTLALIVAASTAVADNHGDEEMTQSGASDSGQTEQDAGMSGDTDMSEDMSNAEDDGEMQTEASMT